MTMLNGLPADLGTRTVRFREVWDRAAMSSSSVVEADARNAVGALFRAIGIEAPTVFRVYSSPAAALIDFPQWISLVSERDCMPCFWHYQLPMCDPGSYWRRYGPALDHVDLAVRRWPNARRCLAFSESLPEQGLVLGRTSHETLWSSFSGLPTIDWMPAVVHDLARRFPGPLGTLQKFADTQDPTCQFPITDFIFLGPFAWLVQEVACVDFCQQELGCRINREFYTALQSVLQAASMMITFNRICIFCDRPAEISLHSILYRDGYEVLREDEAPAELSGSGSADL